jgi:hypothetical protein
MAEVFISYRHISPDQDLAARLANYLAKRRVTHFLDTDIRLGQEWVKVIDRELRAAKSLIVLLSPDSIRSDMVRQEIKLAHDLNKQILPVRVAYDGALPYDLAAYLDKFQYILWRDSEPFDPICGAILDAIHAGAVTRELEPSPESLCRLNEVTELRGAPLPAADPRLETGALQLDSPFYVRRTADAQVEALAKRRGETILIKGPRQVGKTSLAARARAAAERHSQPACYIDLQLLDESRLRDSATLLKYLAARLARDFSTAIKPKDLWDDLLGDADSLTEFIEKAVLANSPAPVLVCLDEVDNIFKHPYRDDFFGLLRGWHNRRATHVPWRHFNLLISHSTEPALFIRDLNQSPFNVGTVFRLNDFDRDEILWLNQRHDCPLTGSEDLERFILLLGGHPYLVRQALYAMANAQMNLAQLETIAADDTGPFGDHLRRHLWALRNNDSLLKALKLALSGAGISNEDDFQRLRAAGLISGDSRQTARPRCRLYAMYLEKHL